MAENILGITGNIDISDIQKSFDELIDRLTRLGVATDAISSRMTKALNDIANSSEKDLAAKTKAAMKVLNDAIAETNNELQTTPQTIKKVEDEAARLQGVVTKLEKEIGKAAPGSKEFDALNKQLEAEREALRLQTEDIADMKAAHEQAAQAVQKLQGIYDSFVASLQKKSNAQRKSAEEDNKEADAQQNAARETKQTTQAINEQSQAHEQAASSVRKQAQAEKEHAAVQQQTQAAIEDTQRTIDELVAKQEKAQKRMEKLQQQMKEWAARGLAGGYVQQMGEGKYKVDQSASGYNENVVAQMQKIANEYNELKKSLQEYREEEALAREGLNALTDSLKQTEQQTKQTVQANEQAKQSSPRQELMNLRNEITMLTLKWREMTDAERASAEGQALKKKLDELSAKASKLQDAFSDVQEQIKHDASDTSTFQGLTQGLNLVISGFGAAQGAAAAFGMSEEELARAQTIIQGSLAATNFLTEAGNALQQQSALMRGINAVQTWAAAKAIDAETAAKGRNIVATKAATVAQGLFNAIARANPYVLLATAIITVVGALAAFVIGTKKAKKEEEEMQRVQERQKEFYDTYNSTLAGTIDKYRELEHAYKKLKSEKEKTKWIKDNRDKFHELGLELGSIQDTETVFAQNTDQIIRAFDLRTRAAAYAAQVTKLYNDALAGQKYKVGDKLSESDFKKLFPQYANFKNHIGDTQYANMKGGFFSDDFYLTQEGVRELYNRALDAAEKQASIIREERDKLNDEAKSIIENLKIKVYNPDDNDSDKPQKSPKETPKYKSAEELNDELLALTKERVERELELEKEGTERWVKLMRERIKLQAETDKREARKTGSEAIANLDASYKGGKSGLSEKDYKERRENLERQVQETIVAITEKASQDIDALEKQLAEARQKRNEELVARYQSYTDQRLAIEKEYKEAVAQIEAAIAELRTQQQNATTDDEKQKIQAQIDALLRSLGEVTKQQMKSLSDVAMKELQDSPLFSLAWKDLQSVSTETLNMLISKFKELEGQFAANPEAMKEWSERVKAMSEEVLSRNPFKAMAQARLELQEASKRKEAAKAVIAEMQAIIKATQKKIDIRKAVGEDTTEDEKKLAAARQSLKKATDELGQAESDEAEATSKQKKSWDAAKNEVDELANAIAALGNQIGGEAGQIMGIISNVMTFATTTVDGIKAVSASGAQALSTLEKASVILAIISAAIQLMQMLSTLNEDAHEQYEKYAEKVSEVEHLRQALYDYRMELIRTQQEERKWFSTTGFQDLRDQWVKSAEAMEEYAQTAAAAQAIYENETGGGWLTGALSWLGKAVGWLVSLPGEIVSGILDKLGIVDKNSFLGKAINWMTTTVFGGEEGFIGKLVGELLNAQNYAEGTVAAIRNLRVETREASSGFLGTGIGGHSQETQDLQSFVKEKFGQELFDMNGVLTSVELAKKVMEKYGDKMVGETKETMERLIELKEQYDEWQQQLREFISELYSPLADDMVDALWDWYENGTNILDSFKSYSAETFRSIGKEMVKQLVNTLLFEQLKEKMQALLTAYSLDAAAGNVSEEDLTENLIKGTQVAIRQLLVDAQRVAPVLQSAVETWEQGMESMGITTRETFSSVFNDISSEFKSMLTDLEGDVTDFSKELTRKMYEAILERFVMKAPITVTIDGEDKAFANLDEYLADWQSRVDAIVNAQYKAGTEWLLDNDVSEEIKKREDEINRLQEKLNWYNSNQGYLADEKAALQAKLQEVLQQLSHVTSSEEGIELTKMKESIEAQIRTIDSYARDWTKRIEELQKEIEELQNLEGITDEERAERLKALNEELEQQLALQKQIAKTYADMIGWTMEQKIDASPFAKLGDELLSVLKDTSKSVQDWKKEIIAAMTSELIDEVVYTDEYKQAIRQLQEQYVNAMSMTGEEFEGLTDEEKAKKREELLKKIAEAIAKLATDTQATVDEINASLGNIGEIDEQSPFDNLREKLLSTLTDMKADAASFRKELENILVKDLMEKMVFDMPITIDDKTFDNFDAYSEDWNSRYIDLMKRLVEARKAYNEALASGDESAAEDAQAAVDAAQEAIDALLNELVRMQAITLENAEQYRERLKEIAIDTTFKDMASSWLSSLMDFNATAEDWAKNLGRTMAQRIIEQMIVPTLIQPLLNDLQKAMDDALSVQGAKWEDVLNDEAVTNAFAAIMNAYPDLKKMVEDILGRLNITKQVEDAKTAFNNLTDTIVSGLTDAEMTAEKFAQNIARTLAEQMMKGVIEARFATVIQGIQQDWANALEQGSTSALEDIKQRIIELYKEAGRETQELAEIFRDLGGNVDETFTSMANSWTSVLMSMEATAEDWAQSVSRTIVQTIVEKMVVPTLITPILQKMQEAWDTASQKEGATWWSMLDALRPALYELQSVFPELQSIVTGLLNSVGIYADSVDESTDKVEYALQDLKSEFVSFLADTEADAGAWAERISQTMAEAFIKNVVLGQGFDYQMEAWQQEFENIKNGWYRNEADRQAAMDRLRQKIIDARTKYLDDATDILDLFGLTASSKAKEQSASISAVERITVDQADELIGRMNAGQMIWEQQRDTTLRIEQTLIVIRDSVGTGTRSMGELVTLAISRNQYLNSILNACIGIHTDMVEKMDDLKRVVNAKI